MKLRTVSRRPYWHVDAKWICGIFFFLFMAASLLVYGLAQLTNQKNGPTVSALAIGALFVRGDEAQIKADARKELAERGGAMRPIAQFPDVVITEQDLSLPVADIKLKVFKPLAESIYGKGVEGTAKTFAKTPEDQKKFINDAFLFRLFTADMHQKLQTLSVRLMAAALLLLCGVMYFSAGWGRLSNPGSLLVAVSLPATLLALVLSRQSQVAVSGSTAFGFLSADLARQFGDSVGKGYMYATILGLSLVGIGAIGKLTTVLYARYR